MLESMHYAIQASGGGGPSSTTLFGHRFRGLGEKVSTRLSAKLGIPVVCSWNVKAAYPQDELDVLSNLVCKAAAEKYQSTASEAEALQ